ncbi:MAG: UvrD-helicase domain-containing protein [Deltaproteobacteria bacterium]|nr:UvrD-helicase domain-containing protein [Myxococcales bacterium]MDP3219024.1 UvrD-helicase domain-containing protein [Deltaproteobacteria bacterium]
MSDGRGRWFAFERNTVVRAGAGTGKTEALATVYLHLVGGLASADVWGKGGVSPERIVALTFTEKAAREMRERITEAVTLLATERLPGALESLDAAERRAAAERWGRLRGASSAVVARVLALADGAARNGRPLPPPETWQRIAWSLGGAHIGTFHGFAAGVLLRAAADLGLDPAFAVLEQEESDQLLRSSALQALSTFAQRDVTAVVELMATAGGLGETAERGLVTLIASLARRFDEEGVSPAQSGVTSAAEPTEARPAIVSDALRDFAEACATVPALHEDGSDQRVFALAEAVAALGPMSTPKAALERMRMLRGLGALPSRARTRRIEAAAERARSQWAALAQDATAMVSLHLGEVMRAVVTAAHAGYTRAKAKRAALDYGDLMRRLRDALRDQTAFRREWKQRYDAVLVDEFQDTNRVQRDLLYLLRERRDVEHPLAPGQSLTATELEPTGLLVVGDAKQSIYAFRGADVAVFLETEREVLAAGGERLDLTESHRALGSMLDAINPVTAALLGGSGGRLEGLYDPARDALRARPEHGVSEGESGPRVELLLVADGRAEDQRRAEAEAIARRIAALSRTADHPPGWRAPRMDDVAILVPTWSHLEPIKRALQARGIPYALRGGPGFWDRREVDDLLTLLRFVADPSDRLALASLLRGPLVGLSDAGLANLFSRASGLEEILDPSPSLRAALAPEDLTRLDEARTSLRRMVRFGPTLGPAGLLRQALAERHFAAVMAQMSFGAQRVANVDKLLGLAASAEQRGGEGSDLPGFVRWVDRMRAASQRESEADVEEVSGSVQVLSIHAAKGLEWPVVFVAQTARRPPARTERVLLDAERRFVVMPGGEESSERFKALRKEAHATEEDDARRMLYVALTRARDLLVVSGPLEGGEGDWGRLREALKGEAPFRVRVWAPGEDGDAVAVRARKEPEDDDARGGAAEPSAPRSERRRLALVGGAMQDLAWCARRFHARHELGLREHGAAHGVSEEAGALAKRVLLTLPWARVLRDPEAALRRVCAAAGLHASGVGAAGALTMLKRFAKTALARAVAADEALVVGKMVPWGLRVMDGETELSVTGELDLVLRGEAMGRPEVLVARVATGVDLDEGDLPGGVGPLDAALELALGGRALGQRMREGAGAGAETGAVRGAVVVLSEEGDGGSVLLPRWDDDVIEARALELARGLVVSRASGRWEGRARHVCEGLRCGFIGRCHG